MTRLPKVHQPWNVEAEEISKTYNEYLANDRQLNSLRDTAADTLKESVKKEADLARVRLRQVPTQDEEENQEQEET